VIYIYFVRINGDLITSLNKSITMFEQRIKAFEKFKKVSRYPVFLLVIFIALLFLIKHFILPSYMYMFQFHSESSKVVHYSFSLFNLLFTILITMLILISVISLLWHFNKQHLSIEKQLHLFSYIPVYRKYIEQQTSFYFATHVSLFLKAGMSM